MKPSGDRVGTPAGASLRPRVHAAELRRLGDEPRAAQERCARSAPSMSRPARPASASGGRRGRGADGARGPGSYVEHLGALAQEAREREGVRALGAGAGGRASGASGAAAGLERSGDHPRPASGARGAPPPTGVAQRGRAEAVVRVARRATWSRCSMDASAPSSSGRWPSGVASVLSTASRAPAACAASATAAMSQTWSAGLAVLDPHERRPGEASTSTSVSVGTGRTSTRRREPVAATPPTPALASARRRPSPGAERRLDRARRRHAGGEQDALGVLEVAERRLDAVHVGFPARP